MKHYFCINIYISKMKTRTCIKMLRHSALHLIFNNSYDYKGLHAILTETHCHVTVNSQHSFTCFISPESTLTKIVTSYLLHELDEKTHYGCENLVTQRDPISILIHFPSTHNFLGCYRNAVFRELRYQGRRYGGGGRRGVRTTPPFGGHI